MTAPVEDCCPKCGHEVGDAWLICAWCGQQLAAPAELAEGTRLSDGRYQVLGVLGRGGFGITYDVGDRRLERRVAVKELFPESAVRHGSLVLTPPAGRPGFQAARDRFLREARVLARFTHPGIVRVYEVFEEHGTAYLVMELLEGRTLVELLRDHGAPFAEPVVLDVAGRVAAALRPVHAAGVLHRDVNPSNVMMTHHGRIVVIDFGLARDYDEEQTVGMTRMVTPGYAPLEQYRGQGRFGPATDVYGLAATCYRLATGKVPEAAVARDAGAAIASPRSLNGAISKAVSDAILDGLELEPSHRPQDVDGLLARLGVGRLPEGPRSILLDAMGAPDDDHDGRPVGPAAPPPVRVDRPWRPGGDASPAPAGDHTTPQEPATDATTPGAVSPLADATTPAGATTPAPGAAHEDRRELPTAMERTRAAPPQRLSPARAQVPLPPRVAPEPDEDHRILGPPLPPRLPGVVGPHRPGRRKVLGPLTIATVLVASAAPVVVTAAVVLGGLPLLATMGDSEAHRLRAEHGVAGSWAERRMQPGSLAPARFLRNVVVSLLRSSPMLVVGGVLIAGWYGLDELIDAPVLIDLALRAIGVVVVGVIIGPTRHGTSRFRTHLGVDRLVDSLVPERRVSQRLVVFWLLAVFVSAAAVWLTPSPFPLP